VSFPEESGLPVPLAALIPVKKTWIPK